MPEILVADEHSQVYDTWRERGERGLALSHIDFHCDMRGLLIDRRRGRAYRIDSGDPRVNVADSGNFIAHAIVEGVVTGIRWVHDAFGGRRYDTGTVKYESDLSALPHRLLHRLRGGAEVPLEFEELTFDTWDGPRPGEHLDIDWDGLASIDYELAHIRKLTQGFLERDYACIPETTYLVYSPGYSHLDRSLFEDFLGRLAERFGAKVRRLPPPAPIQEPGAVRRWAETAERRLVLAFHRLGIY